MVSVRALAMLCAACALLGCASESVPAASPSPPEEAARPAERRFRLDYVARLTPPEGKEVRLWVPLPRANEHQTITGLEVQAPWHLRQTSDALGNRILYFEGVGRGEPVEVTLRYTVARAEHRVDLTKAPSIDGPVLVDPGPYLRGSRLLVVDDTILAAHARVTPSEGTTLEKARAYYDHVREHMTYDTSGEGWGLGDSVYACGVGKGNCTDFHSYFQALCLVERIPTRFAIGIYGAYESRPEPYATGGYHCWAEFFVEGLGWIPVDISEADKHPERVEQFFGGHSANRVTLSHGRDLVLAPAQDGPPLNYFVDPYAEVEGKPLETSKEVRWTDL